MTAESEEISLDIRAPNRVLGVIITETVTKMKDRRKKNTRANESYSFPLENCEKPRRSRVNRKQYLTRNDVGTKVSAGNRRGNFSDVETEAEENSDWNIFPPAGISTGLHLEKREL